MAATNVYVNIVAVPAASKSQTESVSFSNIQATTAQFELRGGTYVIDCIGATFGTVTLQRLGPDGSTMMTAVTAFSATGVSAAVQLPPGQYKIALG